MPRVVVAEAARRQISVWRSPPGLAARSRSEGLARGGQIIRADAAAPSADAPAPTAAAPIGVGRRVLNCQLRARWSDEAADVRCGHWSRCRLAAGGEPGMPVISFFNSASPEG